MSTDDPHKRIVGALDNAKPVPETDPETLTQEPSSQEQEAPREPRAMGFDMDEMNEEWAVVLMGTRAVVLNEQKHVRAEDKVRFMTVEAFKVWFSNRRTEYRDAEGDVHSTTWAARWLTSRKRRQYSGVEFRPGDDTEHQGYFNLWRGFSVQPQKGGSWLVFRDHLLNNVCHGDEQLFRWVFGWFAHIFQKPQERIGTSLVLRGAMGSGKTKVGEVIGSLIESHYLMVDDARYVTGQFNAHMASCLLLQAEEAVWAGDKAAEGRLKGLVTSEYQMIEQKGIDSIRLRNYVRVMMTSNEDWVVPAGKDERRFCVLDVSSHVAQNHQYFAEMENELANGGREALLYDLLHFDLTGLNLREIPKTGALLEQKLRSLDPVEAWWLSRLRDGTPTKHGHDWPIIISRQALFADFIDASEKAGIKRRGFEVEIGMKLKKIAPGLGTRRVDLDGNGKRTWCYVLPPLDKARENFVEAIKQPIHWPVDSAAPTEDESPEEVVDE